MDGRMSKWKGGQMVREMNTGLNDDGCTSHLSSSTSQFRMSIMNLCKPRPNLHVKLAVYVTFGFHCSLKEF